MLYARVVITDLDGNKHTITPSGMGDTDVLNVDFTHKAADDFVLTIGDKTGTVKDWLKRGCIANIYVDTGRPPTTLKLYGMVEEVNLVQPVPDFVLLKAEGREVFHVVINNRIVTETYLDTEVSEIVRALMGKYAPYPDETLLAMSLYEGAGTTAHDESKYENDGTLGAGAAAPSWVDGKYGKALSFDGGDYVSVRDSTLLNLTGACTILVWIKLNRDDILFNVFLSKSDAGTTEGYCFRTRHVATVPQLEFRTQGDNHAVVASELTLDVWHHVGVVYDGVNIEYFVNGISKGYAPSPDAPTTTNQNFEIGRLTGGSQEFHGILDEIRIYNRALSADEVKALYDYPYLHDIDVTATTLEDIRFPYRPLKECLEELAALSGYTYRGNPNNVIIWKVEASEASGFTYDESNIEATPEVIETLLPIKNRVYVIGGNYMQVDQEQLDHVATKNTKDKWYAQSFTPARSDLDQVSFYIKRTGDPANLEGEIRTDAAGPSAKVATFIIDKDFIGVAGSWRPVTVEAKLLIDTKYWIVLKKIGDAGNNYEWYHDNAVAGEYADSDDGITWVVHNGGDLQFAFKTHYIIPILAVASDYAHKDIYKWRETVIEDKGIMSRALARDTADAKLEDLSDMTAQIRDITIGDVAGIPELGKLVTITLTDLGVSAVQYVAKEAKIKFKGGEHGTFYLYLRLGREASELAEWLRDLKAEVDRTKVGAFGVERGLINLVRNLSDTAEATDGVPVGTVQNSGTFQIDTAKIDFSDIA